MDTARELTANLAALLRREHDALADFLVALSDFDARRVWAELGYASLFDFLVRELRVSKGSAQYRKIAVELIQQVPHVVEPLRDGRLCFTSIIEAARVVTHENWETILPRFYGLSRREALEVVAALQPHPAPPMRTVVTATRAATAEVQAQPGEPSPSLRVGSTVEPARSPERAEPFAPPAELAPLTAELTRLHVTVSKEFQKKLHDARDARPDLSVEELLEAGLDLLLQKSAKAKGLVDRPLKTPRPSKDDSRIPAHLKREAMERSGGRCEFLLANGERCGSTHDLEFHHVTARAKGGKAKVVEDIKVGCRQHNDLAARQDFGNDVMDRYTGPKRKRRPRRS